MGNKTRSKERDFSLFSRWFRLHILPMPLFIFFSRNENTFWLQRKKFASLSVLSAVLIERFHGKGRFSADDEDDEGQQVIDGSSSRQFDPRLSMTENRFRFVSDGEWIKGKFRVNRFLWGHFRVETISHFLSWPSNMKIDGDLIMGNSNFSSENETSLQSIFHFFRMDFHTLRAKLRSLAKKNKFK